MGPFIITTKYMKICQIFRYTTVCCSIYICSRIKCLNKSKIPKHIFFCILILFSIILYRIFILIENEYFL